MSCEQTNPCDPCSQYDNCGCTVSTTFGCVTTSKSRECLDITSGEDGESILDKLELLACDKGKILLDGDDTVPNYLFDKLEEGLNISFNFTGSGSSRKLVINAVDGGTPIDINAKVSANDTTSGYLNSKIAVGDYLKKTILNPAGNEQLELDVVPENLLSTDSGNQLILGTDGGLMTSYTAPDGSETKIVQGTGVTLSGTGTIGDPYVVSTNPSIQVVRSCFDSVWRPITLLSSGNTNVVYTAGAPEYRYRYDGTIEFRGSVTHTVSFGTYQSANRKFTILLGSIPTTCLSASEQSGVRDLKSIMYIDTPQASADQIVQQYGYIIRKSGQNIILEFQSAFTNATSKSVVVNFEGAVVYPSI